MAPIVALAFAWLSIMQVSSSTSTLQTLKTGAIEIEQWIVQLRRQLHQIPELGYELPETTKAVRAVLEDLGVKYRFPVAKSGIVATIGRGNPVVALRADMDALPIMEPDGLPFRSTNAGRMHACGHDVHTAMLLGAARLLKQHEAELRGSVRLVFQPAEELGLGAAELIKDGALDGVSAAFGFHIMPQWDSGLVVGRAGVMMAGCTQFSITVTGRGGHAALPWLNVDPVLAATHMITAFQGLISRETNLLEAPSIISVTKLEAGTAHNIIPDTAVFHGTIRSLDKKQMEFLVKRVAEVAEAQAASFRCTVSIDWKETDLAAVPPAYNDAATFNFAKEVVDKLFEQAVVEDLPIMATEDFAYFGETVPSTMLFLGIRNTTVGSVHNLHNPMFKVDEQVLHRGAALHAALAMQYLAAANTSKDEL